MVKVKSTPPEGFIRYIGVKIVHARLGLCPEGGMGKYKEGDPGYEVMYEDGYISWSPQGVFYAAYRSTRNMSFGLAMEAIKRGFSVQRRGWNGGGMFLTLQEPDSQSKMTYPYPYLTIPGCAEGTKLLPWQAAIVDIMSDDWLILEDSDETPEQGKSVAKEREERILLELKELRPRLYRLASFIETDTFSLLPEGERLRLIRQVKAMGTYRDVLADRIEAFRQ